MTFTTVRYRVKDGLEDENRALIEAVVEELGSQAPEDFRYMAVQLDDGTFIHLVENSGSYDISMQNSAFKAFVSGLAGRQSDPTMRMPARLVGSYRMLAD